MTRMIVLALVAAVAIQACSARVLLEDAPNVQAVAQQLSALTTQAAETVIGGPMFFVSHVDLYYRVWKVEAAVKYEKTHFDYYGDPEAVAQESLAGIGTDVTVRKEEAVGIIEAANATIYDTVAQAAAGVKDDEVLALLHTIRQTYSGASQAILTEAVKYAQDCGIVARDGLGNHRPVEDTHTVVLAKLSALYSISEEAIYRAVSKANKVVQDALTGY